MRMATFAPTSHPPMLCEHNHGVINGSSGDIIEDVCGESFETDDGLPSFEDCLMTTTGGASNVRSLWNTCSVHDSLNLLAFNLSLHPIE